MWSTQKLIIERSRRIRKPKDLSCWLRIITYDVNKLVNSTETKAKSSRDTCGTIWKDNKRDSNLDSDRNWIKPHWTELYQEELRKSQNCFQLGVRV